MRTLVVTSTFPRWPGDDTTRFVLRFAQELKTHGIEVDVLAPHAPGAAVSEDLDGIQVERFRYFVPERGEDVCYGGGALFNLRGSPIKVAKLPVLVGSQVAAVRRRLRSDRYDLVSAHWLLPQGWAAVQASGHGVPVVTTVHGSDVFGLRHRALTPFKRAALRGSAAVTVNSVATREVVESLAPGLPGVHTIPMGADIGARPDPGARARWRARRSGDGPLLAFVGRLIDWKGVDDLIEAAALLRETLRGLTVVIAGSGPIEGALRDLAATLGISEIVTFAGWLGREDVLALQAAADMVVAPSRTAPDGSQEAQGLSIVEAMALGRPVVAGRVGGIPDAIQDGVNGLLVPPGDPRSIADAVRRLHADSALAARLGAAAEETAARYAWPLVGRRFADLFENVLGARSQTG